MGLRFGVCAVATKNNFIYFLGGLLIQDNGTCKTVLNADRYDLSTNTWDKVADLQKPKMYAYGAAAGGKIYVDDFPVSCEVYHETTNEWQLIARPKMGSYLTFLCVHDKLCLVKNFIPPKGHRNRQHSVIEYYDPEKNEWQEIASFPLEWNNDVLSLDYHRITFACLMRVFKGSKFLEQASYPEDNSKVSKKCVIM